MSPRDIQRSKVYAAETFVRTIFDRAAETGLGAIDFFGEQITLPPEAKFSSVEAVQDYVDRVLELVGHRWPAPSVRVRARRGVTAAHYEPTSSTIAVPERQSRWALRELVVLHEIAHHLSSAAPAHGPEFTGTFCELAAAVMGPEAGHVLRVVYVKEGAR